jgi:hypothetical protein
MMDRLMTTPVVKTAMKIDETGVIEALELAFVADPRQIRHIRRYATWISNILLLQHN